jgi:hypothetical protein
MPNISCWTLQAAHPRCIVSFLEANGLEGVSLEKMINHLHSKARLLEPVFIERIDSVQVIVNLSANQTAGDSSRVVVPHALCILNFEL